MMPFFALVMLESRLLRMHDELRQEHGEDKLTNILKEDLIALIYDRGQGKLKAKKILFHYTKVWSEIDLKPFNNSEITTLEEHIKRKWADISAETAGEHNSGELLEVCHVGCNLFVEG